MKLKLKPLQNGSQLSMARVTPQSRHRGKQLLAVPVRSESVERAKLGFVPC